MIDWFDRRIVAFMLMWAPFGDPPEEEAFVQFGVSLDELRQRFETIVHHPLHAPEVSESDATLLLQARRLMRHRRVLNQRGPAAM